MFEFVKRSMLVGLGLAHMTKEKIAEAAKDLSEKGKLSGEEGRKLYDQMIKESQKARKDVEDKIAAAVDKAMNRLPANRKIDELIERIEALEKAVHEKGTD